MEDTNRVYRIRTVVGEDAPNVIHVPLKQSYDMFEILSLKLDQKNTYKTYDSDYGVIVGRVTANGGFGVPNAKVSIFIEVSQDETFKRQLLYNFYSVTSTNYDGVRYNVLPDFVDDACHQDVGTFPNKRLVLDNQDIIEIFDKYWKYTTTTNHAGDYMLFGIPTGSQQLHVDVDLSDCGILSQRPRDMIGKGYNATMFESPNKFKYSTNLNSLAQIISQDRGVYVYPYWGDVSEGDDNFSITRCDINLEYKFESYAVFIGSIITDKGSNAIGKNCTATENNGKMSDLIAGEGTIEMIRKTLDNKVEEFPIMGNRLIDGDGVWCYQIPMNLDYVTTDEFGNLVPTDNPEKGIATRTRVRFRISLDENPNDATARKRARYLVPNNPRMGEGEFDDTLEADYEFGTATREESYCDMFWNKVYTVKNYIPKLQKNSKETNRKHTGIKLINHYGSNSPMPYNALTIKLSFTYRIICTITKVVINLIEFVNEIISILGAILCLLLLILDAPAKLFDAIGGFCISFKVIKKISICPFKPLMKILSKVWRLAVSPIVNLVKLIMPNCIGLSSEFCDDGINQVTYYPGCGYFLFSLFKMPSALDCVWDKTEKNHQTNQLKICENEKKTAEECEMSLTTPSNKTAMLYNCVENQLAQQNDATSFNFYNDWVNGVLYAPLWYRKITPKKRFFFGLFRRKAKDDWCSSQRQYPGMRILQQCTTSREVDEDFGTNGRYLNFDGQEVEYRRVINYSCDSKCHKRYVEKKGMNGVICPKQTMLDQTVYYYKAIEHDTSLPKNPWYNGTKRGDIKLMFATDIVLLGSLNDCDTNGVPQFFKSLENTTYRLPSDILFTDYDFVLEIKADGDTGRKKMTVTDLITTSEMAGCDWGNPNEFDKYDGGLFYSIGCTSSGIKLNTKSCINLSRICEYGVSLDETKEVANLEQIYNDMPDDEQIDTETRYSEKLITDGFISWDELYNLDERSMFATMNGNNLKTKLNTTNGLYEYDFRYLYPENFDGSLKEIMKKRTERYASEINYKNNYKLEEASRDYYIFRMGNKPYYYDMDEEEGQGYAFPRYENSFYFYFGLHDGKTAIEKFNSQYFAECINPDGIESAIGIKTKGSSWCSKLDSGNGSDGYLALDLSGVSTPYNLLINGVSNGDFSVEINDITDEKIMFVNSISQLLPDYVQLKGTTTDGGKTWTYSSSPTANIIPMFNNGSYKGVMTDSNGDISEFSFTLSTKYLSFKVNAQSFEQPNNVLLEMFSNDYDAIAAHKTPPSNNIDTTDEKNIQRLDIGGVITVFDIFMDAEELDYYRIEIRAKKNSELDKSGVYSGASLVYIKNDQYPNGQVNILSGADTIFFTNNQHYAFGLPKGSCEYTITIVQLCGDGIDSDNVVSKDVFVGEPMPFKMFINEIDYDVIKEFNHNTGWTTSSTISQHNVSESTLNVATNPWFHVEKIYYNNSLVNGHSNNEIVSFIVEKDDEHSSFEIKAVLEDNSQENISIQILINEFATNTVGQNGVKYNWVDDYIVSGYDYVDWNNVNEAYEKIDGFIDSVNNVFNLRKELVEMMKEVFYIYCEDESKDIYVRAQTDKLPYTQTIVYHPEKAVEFGEYNILDGQNLLDEDISDISDIRIPTISYESSERYGSGNVNSDAVCIAKVENIKKKPYFVAVMNNSAISIPTKQNGDSFDSVDNGDGVKYIKHNTTQLNDLFSFPLIDKILKTDYIVWSAFVNIPKYGYQSSQPRTDYVTMNGLLAGIIYNGNTFNDKFNEQTLNDIELKLSSNFASSSTYIEKRVINGYNNDELGKWVLSLLRSSVNFVSTQLINKINQILPGLNVDDSNIVQILNSLIVRNGSIGYMNGSSFVSIANVSNILPQVLSFTNYIVTNEVQGHLQYAFVLPQMTTFTLQDETGCGINDILDGGFSVELSDTSINDCRAGGQKILEIDAVDNCIYSIFKADTNTHLNGEAYPLNKADSNGILWQIDEAINGLYNPTSNPQNLFSFQMKDKYFRGEGGLIDTQFKSSTLVSEEGEEEEYETTYGYGSTGAFVPTSGFNYPVFIVGQNDKVRALSPVYDYSYVAGLFKYGVLERKESKAVTDEGTGETTYQQEVISDYKFGIALKEGDLQGQYKGQFYLENYEYKLSGICKLDSITTIEINEETLRGTGQFIFTGITEVMYNSMRSRFSSIFVLRQIINNTTIKAVDTTGLTHICGIDINDIEEEGTKWYTYIWNANMPKDEFDNEYEPSANNGGIYYSNNWFGYIEFFYEENETIEPMQCKNPLRTDLPYSEFLGWTENEPNRNGPFIDFTDPTNLKATESRVYFGNWDTPLPLIPVHFRDSNDTQDLDTQSIEQGQNVSPRGQWTQFNWYLRGDTTMTRINFGTSGYGPINAETFFIQYPQVTVHFMDSDDTTQLDAQTIEQGQNVTPSASLALYNWYLRGDTTMTAIDFGGNGYGPVNVETWFVKFPEMAVHFMDCDETTELYRQEIEMGDYILPNPDYTQYAEYEWYDRTDPSKTAIVFGTTGYGPINNETWLIHICGVDVDWVDDNDTDNPTNVVEPIVYNVHFRDSESATEDLFTRQVQIGEMVEPDEEGYGEDSWYLLGDASKTDVVFPYIVTQETTFIRKRKNIVTWVDEGETYEADTPDTPDTPDPPQPPVDTYIFLNESQSSYAVDDSSRTLQIIILSSYNSQHINFTKSIEDSPSWISITNSTVSTLTETITVQIDENNTRISRTATLVFTQSNSGNEIRIPITQDGKLLFKYKITNNKTSGQPIQSVLVSLTNTDGWQLTLGAGGGISPNGGFRESDTSIPSRFKETELVAVTVANGQTNYNFNQTPNPYVWNRSGQGGNRNFEIEIID